MLTLFLAPMICCQPAEIDSTWVRDDTSVCGDLMTSELMMSDYHPPLGIEYGYDRPFIPASQLEGALSTIALPIEYGLQGGHHVDLSLRFVGQFNPDLVDLHITLRVDDPLTDRFTGIHDTQGWYLLFAQDLEPEGCYFHRARIFLFDDLGEPVQALGVSELHGSYAHLEIILTTQNSVHRWQTRGLLSDETGHL